MTKIDDMKQRICDAGFAGDIVGYCAHLEVQLIAEKARFTEYNGMNTAIIDEKNKEIACLRSRLAALTDGMPSIPRLSVACICLDNGAGKYHSAEETAAWIRRIIANDKVEIMIQKFTYDGGLPAPNGPMCRWSDVEP